MAVNGNIVSKPISLREVAQLIGYGGNDLGTLCTHQNINMWAKWKPIRFNNVVEVSSSFRRAAGYGLTAGQNNPTERDFTATSPFYKYLKPRGNTVVPVEVFRISDFLNVDNKDANGYNHNAECPIISDKEIGRLTFTKVFEVASPMMGKQDNHKFDPTQIINTSENVELPITEFYKDVTAESYVGLFFYDVNTKAKFYNAYKVTWAQLVQGEYGRLEYGVNDFFHTDGAANILAHTQTISAGSGEQTLNINNGDTIHVYYCSVPTDFYNSLGQPGQWRENNQNASYWKDLFDENDHIDFITTNLQTIQVVAPDENCGHGVITLQKFDPTDSEHLYFFEKKTLTELLNSNKLTLNVSRGISTISFTRFSIPFSSPYLSRLSSEYYTAAANPEVQLKVQATCLGKTLFDTTVRQTFNAAAHGVQSGTSTNNFYVSYTNGNASISYDRDDLSGNGDVTVYFKVWGVGSTTKLLIDAECTITQGNVQRWYFRQL